MLECQRRVALLAQLSKKLQRHWMNSAHPMLLKMMGLQLAKA
jgi:hypothetical protein